MSTEKIVTALLRACDYHMSAWNTDE